jgi:AraC family transcriptional regulator
MPDLTSATLAVPIPFIDAGAMSAAPTGASLELRSQSSPTGKYGVAIARVSYGAATTLRGTPTDHLIGIIYSDPIPTDHQLAGNRLHHLSGPQSLCIAPVGADYVTEFHGPVDGAILQISAECLALASAQLSSPGATLIEQMNGSDDTVARIARSLELEAAADHPNGMLFWSSAVDALLKHMATHHLSAPITLPRGILSKTMLKRLDDFIHENLAEPLDLDCLAAVVGCDRYCFARSFRSFVGITPHRYVIRLRLDRARTLLRRGKDSLAEVAAATGFSDQSHLSHWIRRIYGTTPARLIA